MKKFNENMHRLLEGIDACVYVVDPQGRLIDANSSWQIYFGHRIDFVRGKLLKDLMHEMIYARAMIDQEELPWEYEHPAALEAIKTGLPATTMLEKGISTVTARPVFDGQHNLLFVVSTVDIQMRLEERKKKMGQPVRKERHVLLGQSPAICAIRNQIRQIADTDISVLITGETGTGKEVVADEIQMNSRRRRDPYVKINCAAFPESLLESELFGYEPGAFTGASRAGKKGLFEAANHGTIFLDEIGELPLSMQSKLLRVLQEQAFRKVGAVQEIHVDVRVLAATNSDLAREVEEGKFRKDLFYRLNVVSFQIADLDSRREDIVLLSSRFLDDIKKKYGIDKKISKEGLEYLQSCHWPGNVRQLGNIIERTSVLSQKEVLDPEDFMKYYPLEEQMENTVPIKPEAQIKEGFLDDAVEHAGGNLKAAVEILEERMVRDALKNGESTYTAARRLGISQPTVIRYIKKYKIDSEKKKTSSEQE